MLYYSYSAKNTVRRVYRSTVLPAAVGAANRKTRSNTFSHFRPHPFCRNGWCRKGGVTVKRVKSACILQALVFSQKPDMGYSRERAAQINRDEVEHYKAVLERTKTRYQITDESVEADGSIVLRVRKQYNDRTDVSEYFE